jgi:hypothetical protein
LLFTLGNHTEEETANVRYTRSDTMTLDAAVNEYLDQITRIRPWTLVREQHLLTAFCGWLGTQPVRPTLDAVSPIFATSYARDHRLNANERDELVMVLHNLCLWANCQGLIVQNPFSLVTMVC